MNSTDARTKALLVLEEGKTDAYAKKPKMKQKGNIITPTIHEEKIPSHKNQRPNSSMYSLPKVKSRYHNNEEDNSLEKLDGSMRLSGNAQVNKPTTNKKEYCNKLGLERINFQFEEYGNYPDDSFQPSIFFFKFLAIKPDLEKENASVGKASPKLRLFIPDTIVLNDLDLNYWIYTDINGYVTRIDETDADVVEKFKSADKDENELIGVSKSPIMKDGRVDENRLDLLNLDELEKCLFSKSGSQVAIQRFVKCRGPKAFVCRSVWRRTKPPYIYILTNKANYHDDIKNQHLKFVVNSKETKSYFAFYSTSGKHLEETMKYMKNIVKFIESHSDIVFDELVGDFVKDEAGIWWFINLKAMKIANYSKFKNENGGNEAYPQLDFFINRHIMSSEGQQSVKRRFDYQTKIKCRFCGIEYPNSKLKYKLTTKMILETEGMLKHVDLERNQLNCLDNYDLKHNDYSMLYLPFRVCEDCYLLFETLHDIKNYQIKIANLFQNPVNQVNFGFGFYTKPKPKKKGIELSEAEEEHVKTKIKELDGVRKDFKYNADNLDHTKRPIVRKQIKNDSRDKTNNEGNNNNNHNNNNATSKNNSDSTNNDGNNSNKKEEQKVNNLYRILIMFNDLFWSDKINIPEGNLYLLFTFLGASYKVPIESNKELKQLGYSLINYMKMFHIICTEPEGFIDYVEKNRHMEIKLGFIEVSEEQEQKKEVKNILHQEIVIEDPNIYDETEKFIPFASVELSLQGLKYGTKYRNMLNGLLFKKDIPYYVGKLRCIIRIHKVKEVKDVKRYTLQKHFNLLIPPLNFVVSEDLPDYWIELVERQKLRKEILEKIIEVVKERKVEIDKEKHKKEIFQALENLISHYSSNNQ